MPSKFAMKINTRSFRAMAKVACLEIRKWRFISNLVTERPGNLSFSAMQFRASRVSFFFFSSRHWNRLRRPCEGRLSGVFFSLGNSAAILVATDRQRDRERERGGERRKRDLKRPYPRRTDSLSFSHVRPSQWGGQVTPLWGGCERFSQRRRLALGLSGGEERTCSTC